MHIIEYHKHRYLPQPTRTGRPLASYVLALLAVAAVIAVIAAALLR